MLEDDDIVDLVAEAVDVLEVLLRSFDVVDWTVTVRLVEFCEVEVELERSPSVDSCEAVRETGDP